MLSKTEENTDIILNSIALMFIFTADVDMVTSKDKELATIILTYCQVVLESHKRNRLSDLSDVTKELKQTEKEIDENIKKLQTQEENSETGIDEDKFVFYE